MVSILIVLPTWMALYRLLQVDVVFLVYILGGVMLGSLLPDVDASDAKIMHGSWRVIGLFGKYAFYRPMSYLLQMKSDDFRDTHRGYLHSLIGCVIATIYFAIPVGILFVLFYLVWAVPLGQSMFLWFAWLGIPVGFLLHPVEDSFTKSGVRWFFPRGKAYSSSTSTGKASERSLVSAFFLAFGLLTVWAYMQTGSSINALIAATLSLILLGVVRLLINHF